MFAIGAASVAVLGGVAIVEPSWLLTLSRYLSTGLGVAIGVAIAALLRARIVRAVGYLTSLSVPILILKFSDAASLASNLTAGIGLLSVPIAIGVTYRTSHVLLHWGFARRQGTCSARAKQIRRHMMVRLLGYDFALTAAVVVAVTRSLSVQERVIGGCFYATLIAWIAYWTTATQLSGFGIRQPHSEPKETRMANARRLISEAVARWKGIARLEISRRRRRQQHDGATHQKKNSKE